MDAQELAHGVDLVTVDHAKILLSTCPIRHLVIGVAPGFRNSMARWLGIGTVIGHARKIAPWGTVDTDTCVVGARGSLWSERYLRDGLRHRGHQPSRSRCSYAGTRLRRRHEEH